MVGLGWVGWFERPKDQYDTTNGAKIVPRGLWKWPFPFPIRSPRGVLEAKRRPWKVDRKKEGHSRLIDVSVPCGGPKRKTSRHPKLDFVLEESEDSKRMGGPKEARRA